MRKKLIVVVILSGMFTIKATAQFNQQQTLEQVIIHNNPNTSSGSSWGQFMNAINYVNSWYQNNPYLGGCDGYGSSWDQCGVCGGDGSSCSPPPTTDCNGDVSGGAFDDPNCGCIGGNTGYADCEAKDPCGAFQKWVRENQNIDTTSAYFNRDKDLKMQNGVCTQNTNPTCDINPKYWNEKSANEKYFYQDGNWIAYQSCGINCLPVVLNHTRAINTVTGTAGKTNWCTFYCLQALAGGSACTYATYYYETVLSMAGTGCTLDAGTLAFKVPQLYLNFGYTLTAININNECDLISKFHNGTIAVLDESPGHNSLVYGVHRNASGVVSIDKFDTSNAAGWDNKGISFTNYNIGGSDYGIQ